MNEEVTYERVYNNNKPFGGYSYMDVFYYDEDMIRTTKDKAWYCSVYLCDENGKVIRNFLGETKHK